MYKQMYDMLYFSMISQLVSCKASLKLHKEDKPTS